MNLHIITGEEEEEGMGEGEKEERENEKKEVYEEHETAENLRKADQTQTCKFGRAKYEDVYKWTRTKSFIYHAHVLERAPKWFLDHQYEYILLGEILDGQSEG